MAAGDGKLRALQKRIALQEEQLMLERNRIEQVARSRQAIVDDFGQQISSLERRLVDLRTTKRQNALAAGDSQTLAGLSAFAVRLERELAEVGLKCRDAEKDFKSAAQLLEAADAELLAVRVEKKRMEKLLDSRAFTERAQTVAREEAMTDEMNTYRRAKRED